MAKVLITSIGTGDIKKDSDSDYNETTYKIENREYFNTLTSQPIIEHFGIEKVFFIGTAGSMWDNLYYKYDGEDEKYLDMLTEKKQNKTITKQDLQELEKTFNKYLNSNGSKCFLLEYNKNNEEEIWQNFEKLLDIKEFLNEDDEIYLDITHGFRYMPILNIFALEFLSQLNSSLKPKAILYGMFAGNKSEILNFAIFLELQEWAKAIEEMEKFASLERIVKLSKAKIEDNGFNNIERLKEAFEIANMTAVYKSIFTLRNHLEYFNRNENKVIKIIAPRIENFIKELFSDTLSEFQFKLAKFYATKGIYSIAYIALAEAIVTYVCEKNNLDENSKENREEAKKIIKDGFSKEYPYSHPKKKFAKLFYEQINKIRNNIAHQLETTKNPKHDIENFNKYYKDSKKYLKNIY